ncbi:MAG TPA: diaminopimelate decarboxylase [Elusimicrobia bacterium]|nr:diaminopimelate decarboxylase [Elusimicrobiota bacterium]
MADCIRFVGGRLRVEGVLAERIAGAAGTPTYAYSSAEIRRRYRAFDLAFADRDHLLCYALKANSNLSLCRVLAREGAGADIVSGGELRRALEAGIPPSKIVFSGVGKLDSELHAALRARILAVNVESEEEARRLELIARRVGRRAPFAVRLNPGVDARTHPHVTTGMPGTKFGLSRREALRVYRRAKDSRWLEAVGIQCHIGSQIVRAAPYRAALKGLLEAADAAAAMGLRLRHVDVGGGMGIVYDRGETFEPRELARTLLPILKGRPGLRLLLEPGRSLVGPAGVLLTRTLYRKASGGRRFVVVDAAMNDLIRPALYDAYHPVVCVRPRAGRTVPMDVVGPVCETADFFAKGRRLPPIERGDLLAVLKAGAYGFSMSSQYNSRPRAAEVLVEGGRFRTIRAREDFSDLVRHER